MRGHAAPPSRYALAKKRLSGETPRAALSVSMVRGDAPRWWETILPRGVLGEADAAAEGALGELQALGCGEEDVAVEQADGPAAHAGPVAVLAHAPANGGCEPLGCSLP